MNIRSAANLPGRVSISFPAKGRTRQSFTKECDINNILKGYEKSGAISHFTRHEPRYGFATGIDFQGAMEIVTEADAMFMDLPANLRARFDTLKPMLPFWSR